MVPLRYMYHVTLDDDTNASPECTLFLSLVEMPAGEKSGRRTEKVETSESVRIFTGPNGEVNRSNNHKSIITIKLIILNN